uniref:VTT domain-containing protein n=1 Tax=Magnetococcus massalia (strain MO-1) TaxID=451514 RepID=A0A1S7LLR0_MAGMO|nr:conserved hypothetical protein; putative membrane protein [Candidatus Magnetococcus massalia]
MELLILFALALLAATILPFSSEVMLGTLYLVGDYTPWELWGAATLGNVAGAIINWYLGGYLFHWRDRRWFPISPEAIAKAESHYQRWGAGSLLLAWVPIIGDPLTLIAGFFRLHLGLFTLLVTIGKGGRYAVVLYLLGA